MSDQDEGADELDAEWWDQNLSSGEPFDVFESQWAQQLTRIEAAALALRGQPFGFTHADVDYLLEVAQEDGATAEWVARAKSLADRISALLPPREP